MPQILLFFLLLTLTLGAQEPTPKSPADLITILMDTRDPSTFESTYTAAQKAGANPQNLLEARFLYLVDLGDPAKLATLAPDFQALLPQFSPDQSLVFTLKQDFQSVVHYLLALKALHQKDEKAFQTHIKEAFWLSPGQASQYTTIVSEFHLKKHLAALKIDLTRQFELQTKPTQKTTLAQLQKTSPLLILYFWSPWIKPSTEDLPRFLKQKAHLEKQGLEVVPVLIGASPEARQEADTLLTSLGDTATGTWLVDSSTLSLTTLLRIQSFPLIVALDRSGHTSFHGHPQDPLFKEITRKNLKNQ